MQPPIPTSPRLAVPEEEAIAADPDDNAADDGSLSDDPDDPVNEPAAVQRTSRSGRDIRLPARLISEL